MNSHQTVAEGAKVGDISTHKEVVLHMIPQLREISEDENYRYIEFGNFLTDISQLRDHVAFPSAKGDIRAGVWIKPIGSPLLCGELDGALSTADANKWLDVMFGDPSAEDKRHGALPTFYRLLRLPTPYHSTPVGRSHTRSER